MVYTGLLVLIGEACDYGSLTRYNYYIVATITVQFVTPTYMQAGLSNWRTRLCSNWRFRGLRHLQVTKKETHMSVYLIKVKMASLVISDGNLDSSHFPSHIFRLCLIPIINHVHCYFGF